MARKPSGSGENEHHVVGVRLRVTGNGNLRMNVSDLDTTQTVGITPLVMAAATRIEPTKLTNFQSQRIRLQGGTYEINEWFWIRRIIFFAKPVVVEYPG